MTEISLARHARAARPPRAASAALALTLLLAGSFVAMAVLGYQAVVIRSGSMSPAVHGGDLLLSRSVPPLSVRPGDLVTFRDPVLYGDLVTHRVISRTPRAGAVDFVTKGDANQVSESWSVPISGQIGLSRARIPMAGWAFAWLQSGPVRVGVIALVSLWLMAVAGRQIWAQA